MDDKRFMSNRYSKRTIKRLKTKENAFRKYMHTNTKTFTFETFERLYSTLLYVSINDCLKVPKWENFHLTDFFYFYTIKPLWVGDFRAKIKNSKF